MDWGGSVHCTCIPIGICLEFCCVSIGSAQLSLNVTAFHFVVESCEHQVERLELFYTSLGPAEGSLIMEDSTFLTVYSEHFHLSQCTRTSFLFSTRESGNESS